MNAGVSSVLAGTEPAASRDRLLAEAMQHVATRITSVQGESILRELASYMCRVLDVDFVLIGKRTGDDIETLAACDRGTLIDNIAYELQGTPCSTVWGNAPQFIIGDLMERYPGDGMITHAGFRSYAGLPLFDSAGGPVGIIAALSRREFADTGLVEALLRICAVRAAAELERLRGESALRDSEEQYRAMFNASTDALILWDSRLQRVDVNPAYERMYGWSREDVLGRGYEHLSGVSGYAEPRLEMVRRALAGEACKAQLEAVRKSGERFMTEVQAIPFRHRGEPHVLAIARDITEATRAEQALRASEEQYRAIFQASADALMLWNSQLKRVDVNPAHEKIFGYPREEVVGRGFEGLSYPSEMVRERLDMVRRALGGETIRTELEAQRKDGRRIVTELRTIPFLHHGEPHVLQIARDVTERRRTEEALRASEEQYRAIFNAGADAMVLRDADFRIVDLNPAFEKALGVTREAVLGERSVTVPFLGSEEDLLALHRRVLGGERERIEADGIVADGQRAFVELLVVPMQYRGEPHVLYIGRNITERKRAEAALRASEEQYRAIFGASADGLLLMDREARIIDVNRAFMQMFGYTQDELSGSPAATLAAEPNSERWLQMLQAITTGEPFETEGLARHRDGGRFPVNARGTPVVYRGETHLLITVRDISRRIEEQRKLVLSEQRLRATVGSSRDCIVAVDRDGRIMEFNPMAEQTFRIAAGEAIGREMAELMIPPQLRAAHLAGMRRYLESGESRVIGKSIEVRAQRADGEEFDAELTISLSESDEGRIFIAFLRDLTEQKAATAQREQLQSQLRQAQKMEAIGHLAGGIAHDFNNLLTSLTGYVVMAQERLATSGEQKAGRYLEKSLRSAERARSLVQQLLVFSRGQRGDRLAVDLAHHLGEFEELLRSTLPSSVQFSSHYQPGLPAVLVDPTQLDQVLMNLCINARDAMESHGSLNVALHGRQFSGAVCSACRKEVTGEYIELAVRDSGHGIAPELLERIFDPFFTTKLAGKGTGMGLSTTHGIVHDYGGHILVDTAPGGGSTFRVLLPRAPGSMAPSSDTVAVEAAEPRGDTLSGTMLLVDDDANVLEYMEEQLREWGLGVHAFADPRVALSAVTAGELEFDIALVDQTMPGMSGLKLARSLTELLPDPKIILYTGYSEPINDDECRDCYVIEVLHKPIDHAALHRLLRENLPG